MIYRNYIKRLVDIIGSIVGIVLFLPLMIGVSIFIKIVSFIPLLSALVAPVIYLLGQTTIIELIISNKNE